MLFLVTPDRVTNAVKFPRGYYVLDTDDLVIEKVDKETLFKYMTNGTVKVINAYVNSDTFLAGNATFSQMIIRRPDVESISCLGGRIVFYQHSMIEFDGESNYVDCDRDKFYYASMCIGRVKNFIYADKRIAYAYKLGDYIIIRVVVDGNTELLVTLIVTVTGDLIDVLIEGNYPYIEVKWVSKDPVFSAKFKTVWGRRY